MSISVDVLEQLADIAEMPEDDDERRALLWQMTDFFLESGISHHEEKCDFFGELMEEIAFSLERRVREELARKIAAEAGMPHGLMVRLANDEIPVARPVLEQSPVLTNDDLIDISHNRGQDHMFAITKRRELSIRLSTVLAERGNEDVVSSYALLAQTGRLTASYLSLPVTYPDLDDAVRRKNSRLYYKKHRNVCRHPATRTQVQPVQVVSGQKSAPATAMNTKQQPVQLTPGQSPNQTPDQTQWQTSVSAAAPETSAQPERVTRTIRVSSVKPVKKQRRRRVVRQVENPLNRLRTSLPAD